MNAFSKMVEAERLRYAGASMGTLRNVMVALSLHSWGNTMEEQARLQAVQDIVSNRLARRMKERVA
jgi:hypothetical protein